MPNDCWNIITITSEDRDELNALVQNEFQRLENNEFVYHETVTMKKKGCRGILLKLWSAWNPPYDFLEELLTKYPSCWVKNEWNEEGGFAGVWIGYVTTDGEKDITHLEWDDLSIEDKHFLFMTEEEEQKYENQRSQIYNPDTTINSPQKIIKKQINTTL